MSLIQKVNAAEKKAIVESNNARVQSAAKTLHESVIGEKCPNLVSMIESGDKASQYKAVMMTTLLENTMNKAIAETGNKALFTEANTTVTTGLNPGVASVTPRVLDIVNRH